MDSEYCINLVDKAVTDVERTNFKSGPTMGEML